MSEENIIYQDDHYIFYEKKIYSRRCHKFLKKYKGGKGAKTTLGFQYYNYWWSYLQTPRSKKTKWYRLHYPITLESLSKVYNIE